MSGQSSEDERSAEEQPSAGLGEMSMGTGQETPAAQGSGSTEATQGSSHAEGRRTQLRIVRESVENLTNEVARFRRSHEVSTKKLEGHVASLRKDLATHLRSKDLGEHVKKHDVGSKRLEQQVASLRKELASLKSQMAKDAAKSRAREEALLSKIAAKVKAASPTRKLSRKKR
jgi:chaperonin cofactor prefoldin